MVRFAWFAGLFRWIGVSRIGASAGWRAIAIGGAVLALLPSLYIGAGLLRRTNDNWAHIREYMLLDYALESMRLVLGTGLCAIVLGVTFGWLIAAYDFPGRRFMSWALVLPLAIPPYILAYTYGSMLSYTGAVQSFMRNVMGWMPDQRWFDIMSMKGAIFVFTATLFPYVYLIVKTFLEKQSSALVENARLLGHGPLRIFIRVVLPLSRPAIVGGTSLVAFEVLNDFGVTKHFGIQSFSTAIFKTWFGMNDVDSALRLAAILMCAIIGIFLIERLLRRYRAYSTPAGKSRPLARRRLRGAAAWAVWAYGTIVLAVAFFIPLIQLLVWAGWTFDEVWNAKLFDMLANTLKVSGIAIALLMLLAVIAANVTRLERSMGTLVLSRLIAMGYSIPGAVLAIGVMAVFISVDRGMAGFYAAVGLGEDRLVLTMSLAMLVFAYIVRFLAVGYHAVESGFDKIGNRYTEAARLSGYGVTAAFFRIDLPLVKGAIGSGCILAFMEIVKELPLTLLLRPFNFDTLATKAYQYASDEQIHQAAIPSLLILAVGIVFVWFYHALGERGRT